MKIDGYVKVMAVMAVAVLCSTGHVRAQVPPPALHAQSTADTTATLANLMAAFESESTAKEQSTAWAEKADAEGYKKVAQLFRAVAKSEEIHIALHSRAIKDLGGTPKADIKAPVVKSTRENLARLLKGETLAAEKYYPRFLKEARKSNIKTAVIAFSSGIKVYAARKMIYEKALKNLSAWKTPSKGFMVCLVCGNLVESLNFKDCPICEAPLDKFETVK